jgi:hypothetical protein
VHLQENCRVESSQELPLLAMLAGPPHRSTHVFSLASHQVERVSEGTELTGTVQHGMGVLKVWLPWAEAKPAKAEAATTSVVE